ncbi:MAG: MOP flippase family protein [Candidatus Omnitrophota bacterium]
MNLKFKVISGTIWNAFNSGFSFIVTILTVAVLARLLRPEDFGLFAMITVIMNLLDAFADMGVSAAIISYRDVTDDELHALFGFNIAIGAGLTGLFIFGSPAVVDYYHEPRLYVYLWILAFNFILTAPATLFNVLMKKHMQFDILSKINMASTVVYAVVTVTYAFLHRNIMSFIVGLLVQSCVTTGLNVYYGLKIWKPRRLVIRYATIRRFMTFGLFQMGERIINKFNWNIDYLMIGRFLGAEALGYYAMAYNLMLKPIQRINPIITGVAFPALSEIQHDNRQLKRYYLKMIRYIVYIMVPIYLLFFIQSKNIILLLYGPKWLASAPVLSIFAFLGILYAVGNPLGNLLLAKGRADVGFWLNMSQTLVLMLANYIGVYFGITGVAYSTLIATLAVFFPIGFFIRYKLVKMTALEFLDQLKKPLVFGLIAAALIMVMQPMMTLNVIQGLVIGCSAFLTTYALLLGVFDKQEFRYLWQTFNEFRLKRKEESCVE